MELVFFIALPEDAVRVSTIDDLGTEPAAEPIAVAGPRVLTDLVGCVVPEGSNLRVEPLRDATCQSFPVWSIPENFCTALAPMEEDELDARAASWSTGSETDPYERSMELTDLRDALRHRSPGQRLYALLEERAL
ncbi:MAG: hypothetical protein P8M78_02720 [Myxococcota bacterium]|nr:hypothetical protein [Myxococcota bacterium]